MVKFTREEIELKLAAYAEARQTSESEKPIDTISTVVREEDEEMEKSFREVLARWQAKGQQTATDLPTKSPDLIQIGRR